MTGHGILDLDSIEDSLGLVKIGGTDYEMIQPPYKQYILLGHYFNEVDPPQTEEGELKEGYKLLTLDEKEDRINKILKILKLIVPKCPVKQLEALSTPKLVRLNMFLVKCFVEQLNAGMKEDDTGN